jgi:hypothetical protein
LKNRSIYWLLLLQAGIAQAQAITRPIGAPYLGVFGLSQKQADVLVARNNPAAHANVQRSSVGVYGERRYMLPDLQLFTASAGLNTASGNWGLHAGYFGFAEQNQMQLSLAYGRKITKAVDVGGAFHYHTIRQSSIYGSASAITGSVGVLFHLGSSVHAGISAFNPIRAAWSNAENERLPSRYSFGLGMDVSENFFLGADLVKEENLPAELQVAFHYQLLPKLFVRGGITTLSPTYFASAGFVLKSFRLDIASSYHPQLGFSPGVLLLANLGKKQEERP